MALSSILIIASIVAALLSGSIDRKCDGNGQLRKVVLICCAGVICISLIPVIWSVFV